MRILRFPARLPVPLMFSVSLLVLTLNAQSPGTAAGGSAAPAGLAPHPAAKPAQTKSAKTAPSPQGLAKSALAPVEPQPAAASGTPIDSETNLLTAVPLKITLTPSETPIKLGSTSNIAADILNVSNRAVEIDTNTIQLMTHAILSKTDTLCVLPLTPTTNTTIMGLQILQPQDHLTMLFNLSQRRMDYSAEEQGIVDSYFTAASTSALPQGQQNLGAMQSKYQRALRASYTRSCDPQLLGPIERSLDFTPGNYEYFLTGKFSLCDPVMTNSCPIPTRPYAQSATFQVGIDQTQIILFAVVGGLLAYLVVTVRNAQGPINQFFSLVTADAGWKGLAKGASRTGILLAFNILRDVIGVAILSAAFTIVSARLSDSQFPIKVSVLDGWGAITIGFLSYFAGNKFIDSLRNLVK